MRGTFGNIRLRNRLADGKEGPYTVHLPDGEPAFIYDAAMAYQAAGVPCLVIAGKEYGSGSSRDWAAKGTTLLGVLTGREAFTITGLAGLGPRQVVTVTARSDEDGVERTFEAVARLDGPIEVEYLRHGGILPAVLRRLAAD